MAGYNFLDGHAVVQYKSRKKFLNMCMHKTDFGVEDKLHFSKHYMRKVPVMVLVELSKDILQK